jgi:hypothetical protein
MTATALQKFTDPGSAVNLLVGRGYVEAAFTRWTLGERVYGDEAGGRFLKRLAAPPPEIWEIRVTEPIVQARIFGRFACPDTFIVTASHTRQMLGRKGSQGWVAACSACVGEWNSIFAGTAPFAGVKISDYVTENCDEFPLN